jgi:predicted MPP superfamily phosphohydrolase
MYLFIALMFIFIAIALYRSYMNTKDVAINHIEINPTKTKKSPHVNVLQLSDLHLENISISPEELYNRLKDEKIDLIAITGDFLDRKRSIPKLHRYMESLSRLNATYGMYAVLGNHDYVLSPKYLEELKQTLSSYGCKVLLNEHETIDINGSHVEIIGIDDFSTDRSELTKTFAGIKDGYRLILTHDPNIVLHMKNYRFDYLMSGHFHGGQIHWPKPYHLVKMGRLVKMNMVKGLHSHHGKNFYISEGLGQTGVNIRIGSRPEITMHRLSLLTETAAKKKTLAG